MLIGDCCCGCPFEEHDWREEWAYNVPGANNNPYYSYAAYCLRCGDGTPCTQVPNDQHKKYEQAEMAIERLTELQIQVESGLMNPSVAMLKTKLIAFNLKQEGILSEEKFSDLLRMYSVSYGLN